MAVIEQRSSLCAHCGGSFIPNRVHARFCSNKCRQREYRKRVTASTPVGARCCDEVQPTQTYDESDGAVERGNTAAKAVTAINAKTREAG